MANLPPTNPNAEHVPRGQRRGNMPAGTRRGVMDPSAVKLAKDLTARAKLAAARAKMNQRVVTTVSVEIFAAIVELAEEYERPIRDIVRQCLLDGLRRYKQFRNPYGPFGSEVAVFDNHELRHAPADERHDVSLSYRQVQESDDTTTDVLAQREALSMFLPGSPSPPGVVAKSFTTSRKPPAPRSEFHDAVDEGTRNYEKAKAAEEAANALRAAEREREASSVPSEAVAE